MTALLTHTTEDLTLTDLGTWLSVAFGGIAAATSSVTLGHVVADRRRQNQEIRSALIIVRNKKSVTSNGITYPIAEVENTGASHASLTFIGIAGVDRVGLLEQEEFQPKHSLNAGESFQIALPPGAPRTTWFLFIFTDTVFPHLARVTWHPAFGERGVPPDLSRWEGFKRRITPRRSRRAFPVGLDAHRKQVVPVGEGMDEKLATTLTRFYEEEKRIAF